MWRTLDSPWSQWRHEGWNFCPSRFCITNAKSSFWTLKKWVQPSEEMHVPFGQFVSPVICSLWTERSIFVLKVVLQTKAFHQIYPRCRSLLFSRTFCIFPTCFESQQCCLAYKHPHRKWQCSHFFSMCRTQKNFMNKKLIKYIRTITQLPKV